MNTWKECFLESVSFQGLKKGAKPRRRKELEATVVSEDDTHKIICRIPYPRRREKKMYSTYIHMNRHRFLCTRFNEPAVTLLQTFKKKIIPFLCWFIFNNFSLSSRSTIIICNNIILINEGLCLMKQNYKLELNARYSLW